MLPLAPRPFSQLARRCWRLRLPLPLGYAGFIDPVPWYRQRRRRRPSRFHQPRARRAAQLVQRSKLPPMFYQRCEVA